MIVELTAQALSDGTSATRQRRAMRCRGRLTDVVDQLLLKTAGGRLGNKSLRFTSSS